MVAVDFTWQSYLMSAFEGSKHNSGLQSLLQLFTIHVFPTGKFWTDSIINQSTKASVLQKKKCLISDCLILTSILIRPVLFFHLFIFKSLSWSIIAPKQPSEKGSNIILLSLGCNFYNLPYAGLRLIRVCGFVFVELISM
ncbi:hypothetical protein S83_024983 [Arachis hypogaea]